MSSHRQGNRRSSLRHRLRTVTTSLAFYPTLFAVAALALAVGVLALEPDAGPISRLFPGNSESARAILGAITGSTITLAGLVFSITMLVIQLSSSQYSPRVLRTFLADRNSHLTLATFVGTFTYSVVVLRAVGSNQERRPVVSVTVAQILMLVTIGMLVQYINHITRKIRVTSILRATMSETVAAARRQAEVGFPVPDPQRWEGGRIVAAEDAGFLAYVDRGALVAIAADSDGRVRVVPPMGDFVAVGEPLLEVWHVDPADDRRLVQHVELADERDIEQDVAYGVRQLLDIALRALSPSLNDPTTAAQAVDHLRNVLLEMRRLGPGGPVHRDGEDRDRLLVRPVDVEDLGGSALQEIRRAAGAHLEVREAADRLERGLYGPHP